MLWKGNKTQSSLHFSSFSSKSQILILWTFSLVLGRSGHWWDRSSLTHPSLIDSDFYHESLINENKRAKPKCLLLLGDCFALTNVACLVRTVPKKKVALTHQRDPCAGPEDLGAAPSCTERSWVQCCPLPGVHLFLQYLPLTFYFPEGLWASRAPNESQGSSCHPCNPHSKPNPSPSTCHPEKSLPPAPLFPSSNVLHVECAYQPAPPLLLSPRSSGLTSALQAPSLLQKKVVEPGWGVQRCLFAATPHRYSGCSPPCWWASSTEFSCIKNCTCQRGKTNDDSNNMEEHPLNIWEGWIMNHFYQGVQEALKY